LLARLAEVAPRACRPLRGCDCCNSHPLPTFTRLPRHELVIGSFELGELISTANDAQWRYFLPRLMELYANDAWGRFDVAALQRRLARCVLPADERAALEAFREEDLFSRVVELRPMRDGLLLTIGDSPFLSRLDRLLDASSAAPRWYAQSWCELGQREGRWSHHEAVVGDWLLSHDAAPKLERGFFAAPSPVDQQRFSTALQVCEWFQNAT
jgi:hypothetical protein